jgi:RNA polymerase sigma-70 factor (ECF subfamily)
MIESLAEHRSRLVVVMSRHLGNQADAEDAVQEAMVRAIQNADRFKPGHGLFGWLVTIALNVGRNMHRVRARRRTRSLDDRDELRALDPLDPTAELDRLERIGQCSERLSHRDRLLLEMFYVNELDYQAMAAELGISAALVKSRLHAARQRFRKLYVATA